MSEETAAKQAIADIDKPDKFGNTALIEAVWRRDIKAVRDLLDKNASIDSKSMNGTTPLQVAALRGELKIAQLLIDRGANINEKNKSGDTALIFAAWNGHAEVMSFLIEKGADCTVNNNKGRTALVEAVKRKNEAAIDLLVVASLEPGDVVPDGTIYGGISPTRHKPMYVAPADAPLRMKFNESAAYAKTVQVGDKRDFFVPDVAELNVLFKNKDRGALKGTFTTARFNSANYYWSSEASNDKKGNSRWFVNGWKTAKLQSRRASVRCIR